VLEAMEPVADAWIPCAVRLERALQRFAIE